MTVFGPMREWGVAESVRDAEEITSLWNDWIRGKRIVFVVCRTEV